MCHPVVTQWGIEKIENSLCESAPGLLDGSRRADYTIAASAVAVAQLVRAPGCGPGGRGFKTPQPPHFPRFRCPRAQTAVFAGLS